MKRALLLLAAIGIVVIIGLLFRRNNEPTYKGRTLHSWLNNYDSNPIGGGLTHSRFGQERRVSVDRGPGEAIRALGTNAIGPLLAELNCPVDPPWLGATKRFLDKLPQLKVQFRDAPSRRERAAVAFFDSGFSGISAIPELRQLLTNYSTAVYGAHALAGTAKPFQLKAPMLLRVRASRRELFPSQFSVKSVGPPFAPLCSSH